MAAVEHPSQVAAGASAAGSARSELLGPRPASPRFAPERAAELVSMNMRLTYGTSTRVQPRSDPRVRIDERVRSLMNLVTGRLAVGNVAKPDRNSPVRM